MNIKQCVHNTGKKFVDELTELACSEQSITSASGQKQLTALTKLDLPKNNLTFIDVSQNMALTKLGLFGTGKKLINNAIF